MKAQRILLAAVALLLAAGPVSGQTGIVPFNSYNPGLTDTVNLSNLDVHLEIPIVSKTGRALPFHYSLAYDNTIWAPVDVSGTTVWTPAPNWGWRGISTGNAGTYSYKTEQNICHERGQKYPYYYDSYQDWVYTDAGGASHGFQGLIIGDGTAPCGPPTTGSALTGDGSGWTIQVGADSTDVVSAAGVAYYPDSNEILDTNGNYTSESSGTYSDTLGQTAMTVSGAAPSSTYFTYAGPSGNVSVRVDYTQQTVEDTFGSCSYGGYGPTSNYLPTAIVLPDGSEYTMTYGIDGTLEYITLPTGGTISYEEPTINCADGSWTSLEKYDGPNYTGPRWSYTRTNVSGAQWTTSWTDPDSNGFTANFMDGFETSREVYDSGHNLLQTTQICYAGNTSICDTTPVHSPITQRTVTSFLGSTTALASKVNEDYNDYGDLAERDEYAYGPGAPGGLLRQTLITYASLGAIMDRPSEIQIKDGAGNIAADTFYGYDAGAPVATSGVPQHQAASGSRGNLTSVTYRVSATASLSESYTYFDTGLVDTHTHVNQGVASFTYGNCGYSLPTQVSEPVTSSTSVSTGEAWNCTGGVITSRTDANGLPAYTNFSDPDFSRQLGDALSRAGVRCRPAKPAVKRPAGATKQKAASR